MFNVTSPFYPCGRRQARGRRDARFSARRDGAEEGAVLAQLALVALRFAFGGTEVGGGRASLSEARRET